MTREAGTRPDEVQLNPFVPISLWWRALFVGYVLIWGTAPTALSWILHGTQQEFATLRFLLIFFADLLLLLPFLVSRIGGTPTGWLHPLVFPTLMALGISLARSPNSLLFPFTVWFQPVEGVIDHPVLWGWSDAQLSWAHLKGEFLVVLSLISLYLGFILFSPRAPRIRWRLPRLLKPKLIGLLVLFVLVFFWIIQSSGGIMEHIASFGMGRHRALSKSGYLIGIVTMAPMVMAIWYVFDRSAVRSPTFLVLLVMSLAMQFATTGSRSGTAMPLILILAIWIYHERKLPKTGIVVTGVVGILAISVLGEIRQSADARSGTIDLEAVTDFDLQSAVAVAVEESATRRRNSAFLPTVAKVPRDADLLWGRTYVSALAFLVPRAVWPEKPRGVGAHVRAIIYGGQSGAEGYEGGGIPPGAVAEAFWNFHLSGVVFIFLLFGAFQKWVANILLAAPREGGAVGFVLISVYALTSPTSIALTPYFQTVAFFFMTYLFLGVISLRRRRPGLHRSRSYIRHIEPVES